MERVVADALKVMVTLREQHTNRLLACLSAADQASLVSHMEPVTLRFRQRLETAHRPIRHVCFLESGIASIVAVGKGERRQIDIGMIGSEGATGHAAFLDCSCSPHDTYMLVEGSGWRIEVGRLRCVIQTSTSLAACLHRYAHVFSIQIGQTALANAQGKIEERLARWLLMAHDRASGDELHLTHELLSVTLGVRRAGVTTALHQLERPGFISTARGCLTVLDRDGLEKCANGLYGVPEDEYERVFRRH